MQYIYPQSPGLRSWITLISITDEFFNFVFYGVTNQNSPCYLLEIIALARCHRCGLTFPFYEMTKHSFSVFMKWQTRIGLHTALCEQVLIFCFYEGTKVISNSSTQWWNLKILTVLYDWRIQLHFDKTLKQKVVSSVQNNSLKN